MNSPRRSKVRALHKETDASEREAVVVEIERLKGVLVEIARALRGREA